MQRKRQTHDLSQIQGYALCDKASIHLKPERSISYHHNHNTVIIMLSDFKGTTKYSYYVAIHTCVKDKDENMWSTLMQIWSLASLNFELIVEWQSTKHLFYC